MSLICTLCESRVDVYAGLPHHVDLIGVVVVGGRKKLATRTNHALQRAPTRAKLFSICISPYGTRKHDGLDVSCGANSVGILYESSELGSLEVLKLNTSHNRSLRVSHALYYLFGDVRSVSKLCNV